jgi:meso-butanediol dehydrogenase / (S,S)-butanediol dehydrogenase / diacetyl reductase
MTDRLTGRTVVVTGAGSGIGAAIARGVVAEGGNAVLADLNLEAVQAVAADLGERALAVRVDVSDRAQVAAGIRAAVERFGRIDAYFNNAGVNQPMNFLEVTEENFMFIMRINALGVLIGTQEAAKQFLAQGPRDGGLAGKVVNTASIAGRTGFAEWAPYSAAKASVITITQSGARDLASRGVTVNAFAPGVVATPLWTKLDADLAEIGKADAGFDSMSNDILLGRPAQPEDIVPTAVFLASADSDYITGQVIPIEGGMILV